MNKYLILFIVYILFFINPTCTFTQSCPLYGIYNSWPFGSASLQLNNGSPSQVNFHHIENSDGIWVKVLWESFTNTHPFGLTDDEMKELMYKSIIDNLVNCPGLIGTKKFTFYETTICKSLKYCYVKVHNDRDYKCHDDCWPGPDPTYLIYNNEKYYRIARNYDYCGNQCCKYIYVVECKQHPVSGESYISIISKSKSSIPETSCSSNGGMDCLTNQPLPCSGSCD